MYLSTNIRSFEPYLSLLGIDVGRRNECGGCGLNEGIFQCKYAGDGGTKPRSGNNRYENQNKVKQKTGIAVSPVAVKPYPQRKYLKFSINVCSKGREHFHRALHGLIASSS